MTLQLDIFVHQIENNSESQVALDQNNPKFKGKCMELLRRLCEGERMQFADHVRTIGDLRRRSLDLIESGVPVVREFVGGDEVKTYYLKQEDIGWVKEKFLTNVK